MPHPVLVTLGFALAFGLAVFVGRVAQIDGRLSLVWPAAAVAFCWIAASPPGRSRTVNVLALVATATVLNVLTGAGWPLSPVYAVGTGLQALVATSVVRRWQERTGGEVWRLRRPTDLAALVVAAYGGALVSALVGSLALHVVSGAPVLPTAGAWVLRHGTSTFALAAVALRLADRSLPPALRDRRQAVELVLVGLVVAAAYGVIFGLTTRLPLAYLLLPLAMWVALRFSTTVAAVHVLAAGVLVVVATTAGRGPFAIDSVTTTVLLAQAYVAVLGSMTLVLALHRDERNRVQQAEREQALLLRTVIDTTSDGISVFDGRGRIVLRNPAASQLFGGLPLGVVQEDREDHYGVFHPDGSAWPAEDLPVSRALRGEAVGDVDTLVRTAQHPDGRVLHVNAHPMPSAPGAAWDGGAVMAFRDVSEARAATAEVARSQQLLADVLDASRDFGIVATDLRGRITVFNAGAERLSGYTAAEMIGRTPRRLHDPAEIVARAAELGVEPSVEVLSAGLDASGSETRRWTYVHRDGYRTPVSVTVSLVRDAAGAVTGYMGVARDLTEQLEAAADLADSEQRFRTAFETAPIGMMMVALGGPRPGGILRVNPAMSRLLGHDELDLLTMNVAEFSHPDDVELTETLLRDHASGAQEDTQVEKRYLHADGSTVWVRLSTTVVRPHDWEPYALALIEDVTARRAAEEALTHQALHDPLTGLPNRVLLDDRLQHALATARRSGERVGVLYLDLDGFKAVNDSAGHAAGDEMLKVVSARIADCIRPGDTLARLGGDEFAVVCPGVDVAQGAGSDPTGVAARANLQVVATRILTALQAPVPLTAGTFVIGASIGLGVADPGSDDIDRVAGEVLAAADAAMYGAKKAGKNRVHAADEDQHTGDARAARLLSELTRALADDELVVHGQPVLDLGTGRAVAVETLVRWQHPTRGLLSPAEFLDVAEASPLMLALGRRVLEESCRLAAAWSEVLGAAAPDVHVNVSGRQLEAGTLHDDVVSALQRHGLPGHRLVLELTETHMPRTAPALLADLGRLRERGVRIAIDDVGTGYSSLTRLTELPVDALKIDLSFVAGLGVDASCDAVVRAILSIGQALGVAVVAEGVETPAQEDLLRRYGCDTVQGYLYSPPRPEVDLITELRRRVEVPLPRTAAPLAGQVLAGSRSRFLP